MYGYCVYECWTDSSSGLIWQVSPYGSGFNWNQAYEYCQDLNLCGKNSWRLPDIGELRSLIRGCPSTELGSETCKVEDGGCLVWSCTEGDLCEMCSYGGGPALGCYWPDEMQGSCSSGYWSSSSVEDKSYMWGVRFNQCYIYADFLTTAAKVRCVR